ncbi:MAG: 3-oxoacyl-ACP reductase FabG [Deltaproteobacteria bacterium]|nr:3-oxoacyl-ACP reductase FabG [Deltaproteobacteria bacterium]
MTNGRLKGRVSIVTGGAQGIGKAICQRLGQEGAQVALLDLKPGPGEAVAKEIRGLFLQTDCTKKSEVDRSIADVIKQFGKIDILVNNIGWALPTFFMEENEDYWDKVIAVNSKTGLLVTQAVLKEMSKQKGGKIVNLSSDAGRVGQMQGVVYSLCKAGVIGFTKALAREVARYQISVNCICPGPTDTQLYEEAINPKVKEVFSQIIPFKRIAKPEEIAAGVAFFCSADADYITGQVLSVSGGLTMGG